MYNIVSKDVKRIHVCLIAVFDGLGDRDFKKK